MKGDFDPTLIGFSNQPPTGLIATVGVKVKSSFFDDLKSGNHNPVSGYKP